LTCNAWSGSIPDWSATVNGDSNDNGGIVKLDDIGNMGTFGKSFRKRVGNWEYVDGTDMNGECRRSIFHHGTLMGEISRHGDGDWAFVPVSEGWGSVPDQGGMNKIVRRFGWYYSRKGGVARYIPLAEYNSER